MRVGEYTSRRNGGGSTGYRGSYRSNYNSYGAGWNRNRNTVRIQRKSLGPISLVGIFMMLITVMGMIYLTQGTKATSYDYSLNQLDAEIAELEAQREDLAVEKARLTSIAAVENSQVAANMPEATVAAYVAE